MNNARWTVTHILPQTGKLAVVTGANSGIGWHTALELARAEWGNSGSRSERRSRCDRRIRRELPSAKYISDLDLQICDRCGHLPRGQS
jgi:NAD(P)-dependent dehydrogenase (short-subunit alcohol dehydrogenase family)